MNESGVNYLSINIKYQVFCLLHRQKMETAGSRLHDISKSNASGQLKVNLTLD